MISTILFLSCSTVFLLISCLFARSWYRLSDYALGECKNIEIAVLGNCGVGKTLFLSTLIEELINNPELHDTLIGKYLSDELEKELREIGDFEKQLNTNYYLPGKRATRQIVETELKSFYENKAKGTQKTENFFLELWGKFKDQSIHCKVTWQDLPGGYFEVQEDWKYNGIKEILNRCDGLFLLVDSNKLIQDKKENSPGQDIGLQNYMEAVSYRLHIAKKKKKKFPVWLIFTKGDMLAPDIQNITKEDWLKKISQISALAWFESNQIVSFATLISIVKEKCLQLYKNIGITIKQFCNVILEQISYKEVKRHKKRRQRRFFCLFTFLLSLLFAGESVDCYRFTKLPDIKSEETLKLEHATAYINSLNNYISGYGGITFYFYHKQKAKTRMTILQSKTGVLLEEKINSTELDNNRYRMHFQTMVDTISALERSSRTTEKLLPHFYEHKQFINKLSEWDQLISRKNEILNFTEKMLEFYSRIPKDQKHLLKEIKAIVKKDLLTKLEIAHDKASSYIGTKFYPQRLYPLIKWHEKFGGYFKDLDKKYEKYQKGHWEYCWNRYLQKFRANVLAVEKAKILKEFRKLMPIQSLLYQKCPQSIIKEWKDTAKELLTTWPTVDNKEKQYEKTTMIQWFKPYLSKTDSTLVECRQFEKKVTLMIREMFRLDKIKGSEKLNEIISTIENFFHKYRDEKAIKEIVTKWQKRYTDIINFQKSREVKLIIKEYSYKKKIPEKLWDDSVWESLYIYLRLEFNGGKPIILDLSKGKNYYNGFYSVKQKVTWKPWLPIIIKFMDADDSPDKNSIDDDDTIDKIELRSALSIIDLDRKWINLDKKKSKEGYLITELSNSVIPEWLLDIYVQTK